MTSPALTATETMIDRSLAPPAVTGWPGAHHSGATPPGITLIAGRANQDPVDADIIILTLDRPEESRAAIRSALRQHGVSRRLWVLDQGSDAKTLATLAHEIQDRDDAALYRTDHNLGVGGGRNALSALGRGRVIAAIDNDAEFADDTTLARMVATLDAEPDLAAIGCRILRWEDGADDLTSWGYPRALLPRAHDRFDSVTFVGAGHAIRRTAWEDAGPYDASLFFCWEEYDFCLRAIAKGWRVCYRGDLEIRHKVAPQARETWTERRWFHFVRNRLRIARKLGGPWLSLAPRVGGYLIKGARHGLLGVTLRAIIAATRMEPIAPIPLDAAARDYLRRHDTAHRGGPRARWRQEVLGRLEPNLSLISNGTMAGQSHR